MLVYCVVDDSLSSSSPLGDAVETFVRREDAEGEPIEKIGMLAFGAEPNRDADDGTFVGTSLDVTRVALEALGPWQPAPVRVCRVFPSP